MLRAVSQDDSVLPYLKALQQASVEQHLLAEQEALDNTLNPQKPSTSVSEEQSQAYVAQQHKHAYSRLNRELPTNNELLQLFNSNFLEYKLMREDAERKKNETIRNIHAYQREQQMTGQRFSPIRIKYGEEEPQTIDN